ncbi:MAG: hypothetical protein WC848_03700 [Parcubacteria group bacterium]
MTSIFSAVLAFCAIIYFSYKIVIEVLGLQKTSYCWLIATISFFVIANEMVRTWLISNLTIIWGTLFLVMSVYYFLRFKNSPKNKFYLFLLLAVLLFAPIDFHSMLLSIIFIFSFSLVEIFIKNISVKEKIKIWLTLKNIIIVSAIFLALNSYWIFNNAYSALTEKSNYAKYSENSASTDSVLNYVTTYLNRPSLDFIFSTTGDHAGKFYPAVFTSFDRGASFIFVLLAIFSIYFIKNDQNQKRKIQLIVLWILYVVFFTFSLGPNNPMGIFGIFWNHVPGFKLFRDYFKFNRLILPILIVFVSYSSINILDFLKGKKYKIFFSAFIAILVLAKFIPYFFLFPLYRPFEIPGYYYQINEYISKKKIDSKAQIMPIVSWYQTFEWSNQNYDMPEPLSYFIPREMFFNNASYDESYNDKLNKQLQNYLIADDKRFLNYENTRSVGFLVARSDLGVDFLEKKKTDVNFIGQDAILTGADESSFLTNKTEIGKLSIYELKKDQFLPHLYTPRNSLVSGRPLESLPNILSGLEWQTRSAVFLAGQNAGKEDLLKKIQEANAVAPCADEGGVMMPTLEFKKINPTKYRVRVHGASGVFPLVFSESFNEGWKGYLASPGQRLDSRLRGNDTLGNYKILDGNGDDQANVDEMQSYIDQGYVTTLGDMREKAIEHKKWVDGEEQTDYVEKYNIDFVSKNFQGTIQNDNLPDGNIFETWFRRPIENNANHLTANGYANSWVIDTNQICDNGNVKCIKNADGSYDFEMVVEFWPQRLFYVGLAISLSTLLGCIVYLGYDWRKRKNLTQK